MLWTEVPRSRWTRYAVSWKAEVLMLCTELPRVTLLIERQNETAPLPITLGSASVAEDPIRTV